MGILKKIGIVIGIFFGLILVIVIAFSFSYVSEQAQLRSDLPLGEPENLPSDFELTTSQKNIIRAIEVGCKDQINLAYLSSEQTAKIVEQKCRDAKQERLDGFQNDWITNLAIKNHDITKCNESKIRSQCIMTYSGELEEYEVCNLLEDNTQCLTNYAMGFEKPILCLQTQNPQACASQLIVGYGPSVCDIFQGKEATECKQGYIIKQFQFIKDNPQSSWPGEEKCPRAPNQASLMRSICIFQVLNPDLISANEFFSMKLDGESIACQALSSRYSAEQMDDYCLAAQALYTKDKSLCAKTGIAERDCYINMAFYDDSFSLEDCDKMKDEEGLIPVCYSMVASRTNNPSICDMEKAIMYQDGSNLEMHKLACLSNMISHP